MHEEAGDPLRPEVGLSLDRPLQLLDWLLAQGIRQSEALRAKFFTSVGPSAFFTNPAILHFFGNLNISWIFTNFHIFVKSGNFRIFEISGSRLVTTEIVDFWAFYGASYFANIWAILAWKVPNGIKNSWGILSRNPC